MTSSSSESAARLHAIQGCDAHQNVGAQPGGQLRENLRGLIRIKIGEHDGDDLRVLADE